MRIAVDLMGGDRPPEELFEGVIQAAAALRPAFTLVAVATPNVVESIKSRAPAGVEFYPVADSIAMVDEPVGAVRQKKQSSIVVAMRLLKKGYVHALVSAGNTGALITSATLTLRTIPGIRRPALLAFLPTERGTVAIVDVGGSVSCRPHHLVQFAHLGSAYVRCLLGVESPTVGLLNIGVESKKGTSNVREAYRILSEQCQSFAAKGVNPPMHFRGNCEGRDVFGGAVDVLITDGFSGNVFLKTAEGVADFIFASMKRSLKSAQSEALELALDQLQKQFNYAEYPGAIVCGVNGIVIKCHGHSTSLALLSGIRGAASMLQKGVLAQVHDLIT